MFGNTCRINNETPTSERYVKDYILYTNFDTLLLTTNEAWFGFPCSLHGCLRGSVYKKVYGKPPTNDPLIVSWLMNEVPSLSIVNVGLLCNILYSRFTPIFY